MLCETIVEGLSSTSPPSLWYKPGWTSAYQCFTLATV